MELKDRIENRIRIVSVFDYEFIFVQVENTISIYESLKFGLVQKINTENLISAFDVLPTQLSIFLVCTSKTANFLHLYVPQSDLKKNYQINFK